jgi:hypothetical protein
MPIIIMLHSISLSLIVCYRYLMFSEDDSCDLLILSYLPKANISYRSLLNIINRLLIIEFYLEYM